MGSETWWGVRHKPTGKIEMMSTNGREADRCYEFRDRNADDIEDYEVVQLPPPGSVQVKKLDWTESHSQGFKWWTSQCAIGHFYINELARWAMYPPSEEGHAECWLSGEEETIVDAKASCQSHFDALVKGCVEQ